MTDLNDLVIPPCRLYKFCSRNTSFCIMLFGKFNNNVDLSFYCKLGTEPATQAEIEKHGVCYVCIRLGTYKHYSKDNCASFHFTIYCTR